MPEPDHTREAAARRPHLPAERADPPPTGSWHPADGSAPRIGRYEVRAVLGEGACGRVYRAFDAELAREVAIKVPRPEGLTWDARERFIREARAAANIHDPYVCPIYDVGTDGDVPFLVMRFVAGGTLADLLNKKLLSPRAALTAAQQLALGVAAAHAEGVIHRDLKPGNALWDRTRRTVLVTDFGLARISGDAAITGYGVAIGTPLYMSPEQWEGDPAKIGPLTDVYSLGVILYRMLTGVTPYTGMIREIMIAACEGRPKPPSAHRPELGPGLDALCLRAMAANQAARVPSARAFADEIDEHLRGAGGAEELPLAELIAEPPVAGSAPKGKTDPAAIPAPTAPTRGVAADPTPRPPARRPARVPSPADVSELVVCPRCMARLRIAPSRTTAVPCPMCDCLFSVRAGRQAATRISARPEGGSGPERAEPPLDIPDDSDDAGPRPEWRPVAAGLKIALGGSAAVLGGMVALVVVVWMIVGGSRAGPTTKDKHPEVVKNTPPPKVNDESPITARPAAVSAVKNTPPPKVKDDPLAATGGRMDDATVARIRKATVCIRVTGKKEIHAGSGFFVEKGLVVTNQHVINHEGRLEVVTERGTPQTRTFRAAVKFQDAAKDLAVIEVEGAPATDTLKIADTLNLRETHEVYSFGFPLGERLGQEITVTRTTVSSIRAGGDRQRREVQLNGGIERGNSGGPVTDAAGRVIGVAVSGVVGTDIKNAIAAEEVTLFLSRYER